MKDDSIMRRLLERPVALLLAIVLSPPAWAETATASRFAPAIDKAKRATVGVLDAASAEQPGPSHFIPVGSGFHIGDGYIITARHVVDRDESGRPMSPKDIRVL